jgi:predicted nuclease of predicted toxin-antitoxin system
MIKIFVDENIPRITVHTLLEMGFEVIDIRGTPDEGIHDDLLWNKVRKNKCLLITTDKGFAQYRAQKHYGILIICLKQPNRLKIHSKIMIALKQIPPHKWRNLLVIMKDTVQSTWHR